MSHPKPPQVPYREVPLVCLCYEDGEPDWGDALDDIGGSAEGDLIVLDGTEVRLRPVLDPAWDSRRGGNVPALLPGARDVTGPPVAVVADMSTVYGGHQPLLVDLAAIPGRGVRVMADRLGEILGALIDGTLVFDDLVRGMDVTGVYEGTEGQPAFPAPVSVPRRAFPAFRGAGDLLVRTSFGDDDGWQALLDALGGVDADGRLDLGSFEIPGWAGICPWPALIVDDRAYEGLTPGEVPALVPPDEDRVVVVLADARTFAEPDWPLTAVDLGDTPGQPAVLSHRRIGDLAGNLLVSNMEFCEFVRGEGEPWTEPV